MPHTNDHQDVADVQLLQDAKKLFAGPWFLVGLTAFDKDLFLGNGVCLRDPIRVDLVLGHRKPILDLVQVVNNKADLVLVGDGSTVGLELLPLVGNRLPSNDRLQDRVDLLLVYDLSHVIEC